MPPSPLPRERSSPLLEDHPGGEHDEAEAYGVVPAQGLVQPKHGKAHEHGQRNDFLDGLEFGGGKMAVAGDYLMLPVRSSVKKYAQNFVAKDTYIRFSKLGTEAAPVGAALLSRSRLLKVI